MCSSSATRRTPFGFAWVCPVYWCTGTISRCALGNLLSVKSRSRIQGVFGDRGTDGTPPPRGHDAPTVVVWTIAVHCLVTAMDDLSKSGPSGRLSVKMQICVVQRTLSQQSTGLGQLMSNPPA